MTFGAQFWAKPFGSLHPPTLPVQPLIIPRIRLGRRKYSKLRIGTVAVTHFSRMRRSSRLRKRND